MAERDSQRETVILVHGTFAAPKDGHQWYQRQAGPGSAESFVARLDKELERRGSPARCWAHCAESGEEIFSWSGLNTWRARADAADRLADLLYRLQKEHWKCHVVAHSHGGSVLVEALSNLDPFPDDWSGGSLVTLGTPFLDTYSETARKRGQTRTIIESGTAIAVVGAFALCAWPWFTFAATLTTTPWLYAIVSVVVFVLLAQYFFYSFLRGFGGKELFSPMFSKWKRLLIISSDADEAWQLLSRIITMANPMQPASRTWRQRVESAFSWTSSVFKEALRQDMLLNPKRNRVFRILIWGGSGLLLLLTLMDRLGDVQPRWVWALLVLGYAFALIMSWIRDPNSFFSELRAPLRAAEVLLALLRAIASEVAVAIMRRFGWGVLRSMALGDAGYPFPVAPVARTPAILSDAFFTYEVLDQEATARALARREKGFGSALSAITTTLSNPNVESIDYNALLKRIADDTSLVHAAYYTDDSCIERIAQWLARTETDIEDDEMAAFDAYLKAHPDDDEG